MIRLENIDRHQALISWDPVEGAETYKVYWSDRNIASVRFRYMGEVKSDETLVYKLKKSTHIPHYLKVIPYTGGKAFEELSFVTPVHYIKEEQMENIGRGLIAVPAKEGVFLSWRLLLQEVTGCESGTRGLKGADFAVYRDGKKIAFVTDSTNYLDREGKTNSTYQVAAVIAGKELLCTEKVQVWKNDYLDIPLQKPEGGITPAGEEFFYSANDMSVADVDGDGEYEYIVKWDPSNSHDVSIKGYTGKCYLDCYKLDGCLLWRLDMGINIRAGAHYTQFMCYDFNGDGKAELAVKTAPGTRMTIYRENGDREERFITIPEDDRNAGYSHKDNYVCSRKDYYNHLKSTFSQWQQQPEVMKGQWPNTLEECFGIQQRYEYPLSDKDAMELTDYFLDIYAPSRSPQNKLREIEGFIYTGPEYLTMFGGDGRELDTIPFPFGRIDDGLRWGDYAMNRIEPCNRSDRFLSGVAYLDGRRPSLIVCRGYYTRTAVAAYNFFENRLKEEWKIDSGFVEMENPFCGNPHGGVGSNPVYGKLAGQGNHSLSAADVDGDGCMEIIYGGACIDHDGSLLYSSYDRLPDGTTVKLGHGDAMHVADIDPDRPGFEIFNVFEGAREAPYGFALRDGATGEVIFGQYAESDLGRCMVGDVRPDVRGLQCWVNYVGMYDCHGILLDKETLGSNMSIRWAADLSTQVIDGADYLTQKPIGQICDLTHQVMLTPKDTLTNNGTKGNPCLVADIFGDFREELLLRTTSSSAIRIYTNTQITRHKLFTLMHDTQYRCGVAWQNNCYNQPVYTKFYYASDMDFCQVLPEMMRKPAIYLAGDSTCQSYGESDKPQAGWGEMLLQALEPELAIEEFHRESSPFPQEKSYETRHLIVDNCAMAGRSSRTFLEEGRLEDVKKHIKGGDYLVIQFGHNDAAWNKWERFVALEDFQAYIQIYVDMAMEKGAIPILLSPIALRPHRDGENGELRELERRMPGYGQIMKEFAKERKIPYIDMWTLTKAVCREAGEEETRRWYMADQVHLTDKGAKIFARLVAESLKPIVMEGNYRETYFQKKQEVK